MFWGVYLALCFGACHSPVALNVLYPTHHYPEEHSFWALERPTEQRVTHHELINQLPPTH